MRWLVAALVVAGLVAGVIVTTSGAPATKPRAVSAKVLAPTAAGAAVGLGPAKRAAYSSPASASTAGARTTTAAPPTPPDPAASTSKWGSSSHGQSVPPGTPAAQHFNGTPIVGALFSSAKATTHFCTASVVDSPAGDVLLTAAHCVSGTGAGLEFAPGYDQGKLPYGLWQVTGDHGAPSWLQGRSDQRDFAFLEVAPKTINGKVTQIQDVTGGAQLGEAATAGETVTVPAYASGSKDQPLTCTVKVYIYQGFPAFNCNPYPDGTSGAPWLLSTAHGEVIVGLIGGLHHGGCYTYTSYSSALSTATWNAYARSAAAAPTATFPHGGSDGCSTGL